MTLSEELGKLECPLNWSLPEDSLVINDTRKRVSFKVDNEVDKQENDDSSTWQKICQCLVMFILDFKHPDSDWKAHPNNDQLKAAGNYLQKIEDTLKETKEETLMKKHVPAIQYVTKGTQAHYYYKLGNEEKAKEYIADLKPFKELSNNDQAACFAIRSCCFMEFTYGGFDEALQWINKALHLDPEDPEWNFLKGKCLARTRRFNSTVTQPCMVELQCLGEAIKAGNCSPYHLVFCAQSFLEYARECEFIHCNSENARAYYATCADLFRQAASKGKNNGVVLIRTAKGLMHLFGYGIEDLLKHCVFRALELLPTSGFVNAVVGEWYYIRAKNIDKAIQYLRTASRDHKITSSYKYLLNILFLYRSRKELHEEIEGFWINHRANPRERRKALKSMAAYFFFVRNQITNAAFYMKEWLEHVLKEHNGNDKNSMFIYCPNLTAALVGEINVCLNDPRSQLYSDEEDELRAFLEVVREARPHLDIRNLRTPRQDTVRDCVYRYDKSCRNDPEKRNLLLDMYGLKPPAHSNYNNNSWRR